MQIEELEKGFISKEKILQYVSEEDIFKLVFGYKPVEYQYVTSPFRNDTRPGCWFHVDATTNKLRFNDFGNNEIINGIKMINIDCFDAVQVYFKLPNFYKTLEFIKEQLIDNRNIKNNIVVKKPKVIIKKEVIINIDIKNFTLKDQRYWSKYGITKQQLLDDKVFSVKKYKLLNSKYGDILKRVNTLCYSFNNFDNNRKKLYFPLNKGNKRFITNCKADDIGEINYLPNYGDKLIISKSYKDCRVLRNHNLNCIWFQNEGMIPDISLLYNLCKRFTNIIIFFDNDETGIKASIKIADIINNYFPGKAKSLYLPEYLCSKSITDPSDMYFKMGQKHLKNFIYEYI